jgi:hypothetical protein
VTIFSRGDDTLGHHWDHASYAFPYPADIIAVSTDDYIDPTGANAEERRIYVARQIDKNGAGMQLNEVVTVVLAKDLSLQRILYTTFFAATQCIYTDRLTNVSSESMFWTEMPPQGGINASVAHLNNGVVSRFNITFASGESWSNDASSISASFVTGSGGIGASCNTASIYAFEGQTLQQWKFKLLERPSYIADYSLELNVGGGSTTRTVQAVSFLSADCSTGNHGVFFRALPEFSVTPSMMPFVKRDDAECNPGTALRCPGESTDCLNTTDITEKCVQPVDSGHCCHVNQKSQCTPCNGDLGCFSWTYNSSCVLTCKPCDAK